MKKIKSITLIVAVLVFGGGVLGASIWQTSAQSVSENYQLAPIDSQTETGSVQGQAIESKEGDFDYFEVYLSPPTYPGILPDHLLYPLKMVRDRILLFLTTDPLKKAELFLQFADKRVRAAKALVLEKDKIELGITTLTKAEKYLEKAVNQEEIARQAGKDTTDFLEKLSHATLAHEKVMLEFEEKVPNESRPVYDNALQYARQGYQQVIERMKE